jgi:hypothetical protein
MEEILIKKRMEEAKKNEGRKVTKTTTTVVRVLRRQIEEHTI